MYSRFVMCCFSVLIACNYRVNCQSKKLGRQYYPWAFLYVFVKIHYSAINFNAEWIPSEICSTHKIAY